MFIKHLANPLLLWNISNGGSKLLYDFMPYSFADFVFGLHYSYKNPQNFNVLEQLFFDRCVSD